MTRAEYMREYYRSRDGYREHKLWLVSTRSRALQRLAEENPERFDQLLTEERSMGGPAHGVDVRPSSEVAPRRRV